MVPDYHIHTVLCKHAEGELDEYLLHARRLKLPGMCFTDHAPNPDGYDPGNRMRLSGFPRYQEMVSALSEDRNLPVLFGVEADYYDGCASFLRAWLPANDFDLVIGSVHYIANWCFDEPAQTDVWNSVNVVHAWQVYFQQLNRLVDTGLFDIIGHLDLPKKFGHRPADKDVKEMAQPVLDNIAAKGMVIEINSSGLRKPVREIYPSPLLLALARERRIPICFGSDSHKSREVGYQFAASLEMARNAGYTHAVLFSQRQKKEYLLPEP